MRKWYYEFIIIKSITVKYDIIYDIICYYILIIIVVIMIIFMVIWILWLLFIVLFIVYISIINKNIPNDYLIVKGNFLNLNYEMKNNNVLYFSNTFYKCVYLYLYKHKTVFIIYKTVFIIYTMLLLYTKFSNNFDF